MARLTFSFDVGPNSIGWALVDPENGEIRACGVRVFPEGVDNYDTKKEKPKMEARRVARGMRRQVARRRSRKRKLRALLAASGLLPGSDEEQRMVDLLDPYALRRKALGERLSLQEFGRVLIHLNQRRGFKSNWKSDRGRKSDDRGVLAEINELAKAVDEAECETLGEYLAKLRSKPLERIRNQHTRRDMFETEFDICWERQRKHHPSVLTDELKRRVHKAIFFQREMYWPSSVVGRCELEPRQPRAPRADRMSQRFRLLQEVNNLKYFDPEAREERPLDPEQRTLLLDKLSKVEKMDFDRIRKELGFLESIAFNLERGNRKAMKGMPTDAALAHKDLFGKRWHEFSDEKKNRIVAELMDADDDSLPRLAAQWELGAESVGKLAAVDFPKGYGALSRVALEKLLPHMERGLLYMTDDETPCALTEAGYLRPDQIPRKVLEALPEPPDIANPVVRQAMFELRKLVNGIIREHGKPSRIHIELARDMTMSLDDRRKVSERRQENEDRRNLAADKIRAAGMRVSRDAIDRILLWEEQGGNCAYSGRPISLAQLLQGEAEIDHILPRSRCLDDSMQNKVVAFRALNQAKGNQTPREWLERGDPELYNLVLQCAAHLPYAKRNRFTQKELELDKFVLRQLNDTRYIAREAARYLRCLVQESHDVLCPKGGHTAELRRHWGLNTILRELPDSPGWREENQMRDGEKDRSDHRHHAIDALVVALTDQSRLQQLARIQREGGTETTGEVLANPWPNFRKSVMEAVSRINVSHRVQRRVAGALHEDTIYGPVREKDVRGQLVQKPGVFVVRKPLESLTLSMIEDIRDKTIREIVIGRLRDRHIEFGRGVKGVIGKEVWNPQLTMPSGIPIKKVRIFKRDETIRAIRGNIAYVKPGSVHHLCIFEWTQNGKRKREPIFVSMLEAITRIKDGKAIINRKHPDRPEARFIMSLSRGECVSGLKEGLKDIFVFITAASTSGQMWFTRHTDARKSSEAEIVSVKASTMSPTARKVTVDPLGRIRWAND